MKRGITNGRHAASISTAAFLVLLTTLGAAAAEGNPWELERSRSHHVDVSAAEDSIEVMTRGSDPYLVGRLAKPASALQPMVELEYFCVSGINKLSVIVGPPLAEANRIELPNLPIAEGWQTFTADLEAAANTPLPDSFAMLRFDLGVRPGVRLQIRNVRMRERTPAEVERRQRERERAREKRRRAERIAAYQRREFDSQIERVRVTDSVIEIAGQLAPSVDPAAVRLMESEPHESVGRPNAGILVAPDFQWDRLRFFTSVARWVGNRDRLHSGWRLVSTASNKSEALTARHFASEIDCIREPPASQPLRPHSQKGLGGISRNGPLEELIELGIDAITINLVLNPFLLSQGDASTERIPVDGEPIYFDVRAFRRYDPLLKFAARHDMVVSAIVLIRPSANDAAGAALNHPEADGGIYVMPDLTTRRGAQVYAFVLDRIAERYRHPQRASGGISNWIVHNEIDFHSVWTNMGRQPPELATETYYRSLRMVHNAARQHYPHARTFASLTHHWNAPAERSVRRLAPRELVESLQRFSQREGDFAWGVAYHPYPEDLFAETAWNDTRINDTLDTPLITIQNLGVLDRFLRQPRMRSSEDEPRPVLLSEQGFHTADYSEDAQAKQAGSLWYAMQRVRRFPNIESFHYHRWIDHPDEGGLLLGLRRLPSPEHPHGKKKRSWHVYKAIGTDEELAATRDLPGPTR